MNQNLTGDVSLETLAGIANYSPFHFQKIFSEALLETPKQYVIRLRLERAAHFIKIFPQLAINEIAVNCGFSSNSIFSRAFKNYYGVSAETYSELSSEKLYEVNKKKNQLAPWTETSSWIHPITDIQQKVETVQLSSQPIVGTIYSFNIACIQTTLSHRENISFAFQSLLQWAIPRGLMTGSMRYFGIWLDFPFITPPNKCRYLCGVELSSEIKATQGISIHTLAKGQYLNYEMTGNMDETLGSLVALNHNYIGSMGYTISEMICYEQFNECPAEKSYENITRHLLIPVKVK
ncbi:MAG: helix-turn-helix domain-containing protein [Bacteroidota bacterium]